MNKLLQLIVLTVLLSGCTLAGNRSMPYDAWYYGFFAPDYMEVWIETADVVDINNYVLRRAGSGIPAISYPRVLRKEIPTKFRGDPKGWPERPSRGAGKYVKGADLPKLLYVRWQSMVEPQTYEAYIEIPESTREIMRKGEKTFCRADAKWITGYREAIVVGLAPGGIAKVWVAGPCLSSIEVTRVQATVHPAGPYGGEANGEYDPPSAESRAYIEKFGIPYGSW
jgi:hypothetical protein